MSSALRERGGSEQSVPRPQLSVVPRPRRLPGPKTVLAGIYVLAFAYHWLQSRAHVSPAVFGDELLYSKLAQSVAAGDGFSIRGETVFFPAPLAILAQAPAWLLDSTSTAYGVVKAMNAAFMAAAALPAYFLARRLVRPSYALLAAAAAVAGPAMLYAPYLMSEALAYPVFLLALATMLRAIERPSRRMELAVVAVSLAAVLTRLQFVVLPLAYLLAVPVSARLCGEPIGAALRRHRLSLGLLVLLGVVPLVTGGAVLGTYSGATLLEYDLGSTVGWSARTAALLPFAAGLLIVPGALLGLGLRPRGPRGSRVRGACDRDDRARPARGRPDRGRRRRARARALRDLSRSAPDHRLLPVRRAGSAEAPGLRRSRARRRRDRLADALSGQGRDDLHLRRADLLGLRPARRLVGARQRRHRVRGAAAPRRNRARLCVATPLSSRRSPWASPRSPSCSSAVSSPTPEITARPAAPCSSARATRPTGSTAAASGPADYLQLPGGSALLRLAARSLESGLPPTGSSRYGKRLVRVLQGDDRERRSSPRRRRRSLHEDPRRQRLRERDRARRRSGGKAAQRLDRVSPFSGAAGSRARSRPDVRPVGGSARQLPRLAPATDEVRRLPRDRGAARRFA